jgi:50S ribosomal subunit-associated GTPase HflX
LVKNKWDLLGPEQQLRAGAERNAVCVSASNGTHLDQLRQRITELLPLPTPATEPVTVDGVIEDPVSFG